MRAMKLPSFTNPDDKAIARLLKSVNTIAMVGASNREQRDSFKVFSYLKARGYRVIPVNPQLMGTRIKGLPVRASLKHLRTPVDMVDVFRKSEHVSAVLDEIAAMKTKPKAIWLQLGVVDQSAAKRAETMGLTVVMDRCPLIEYERLIGK